MKRRHLITLGMLLLFAGAAAAAPITYTFTGSASGTVNGNPFVDQAFTFTATGETTAVQHPTPSEYYNALLSGTIAIQGTACAAGCPLTVPGNYFMSDVDDSAVVRGIKSSATLAQDYLFEGCFGSECAGAGSYLHHDLASPFPMETSGDEGALTPYGTFATTGGNVLITGLTAHLTYAAALTAVVPALSSWGLLALALAVGLAGFFVIRGRF